MNMARIYSIKDYSFSSKMIQCDFLLAVQAVIARQSSPVSSTPSVRAIPVLQEGMQPPRGWLFFYFFFTLGRRPWAFETDVREFLVLMQNNQLNITDYISSGFSIPGWQQSANPTFILDFINWNKGGWQEQRCRIEEADDGATCGQHTV